MKPFQARATRLGILQSKVTLVFGQVLFLYVLGTIFLWVRTSEYLNQQSASLSDSQMPEYLMGRDYLLYKQWKDDTGYKAIDQSFQDRLARAAQYKKQMEPHKAKLDEIIQHAKDLIGANKRQEAINSLEQAIQQYHPSDRLMRELGSAYADSDRAKCVEWMEKLIDLFPEVTHVDLLQSFYERWEDHPNSIRSSQRAYKLSPSTNRLTRIITSCEKWNFWENYLELLPELVQEVRRSVNKDPPYTPIHVYNALHMPFTLEDVQKIAQAWARAVGAHKPKKYSYPEWDGKRKIKIGFVSPDFRHHAVGIQIVDFFRFFERSKVEIFCYDTWHQEEQDFIRDKLKVNCQHFDSFRGGVTSEQLADRIQKDEIDVLVDLALTTAGGRPDLFGMKPAALQIAWLGLASTTGMTEYDYIIGDKVSTPPQFDQWYSEKILSMPHSYHIFNHKYYYGMVAEPEDQLPHLFVPKPIPLKSKDHFIFCNFQNTERVGPLEFHAWMSIIKQVPGSIMVLKHHTDANAKQLSNTAEKYHINMNVSDPGFFRQPNRVAFMRGSGMDHVAVKSKVCDMYLDGHFYNGHSNGGDMLWGGVPGVTYPGVTMASRAVASFYTTVGIPEMIASSWEDYIHKAVKYATTHRHELMQMRKKLTMERENTPLFSVGLFARNFQKAAHTIMTRHHIDKLPPQRIQIESDPPYNPTR
ncbi:O-linked GlcNAc transferase like protein [Planoprotostelium fungivorum]|uniref:O-linked GlcNAc transferase like protein n=1 Tax=Planoprotostelium fungivorum TaxID=1890364 RepID=A0A2P6NSC3_9EUKA|nr:O-linked GlcNAc transferase like protein [Planoprotostelium fungivorum]